jgi:ABC-2 type transport system permease protein
VSVAVDVYRRLLGIHLRGQMQYRVSFLLDVLSTGLISAVEFGTLALVLQRFGDIGGWTLGEVAFLYGLVGSAFGTMDLLFSGFDPPYFGQLVRRGRLDQLLLRPVNVSIQVLSSRLEVRRIGDVVLGAAIFATGVRLVGIHWTVPKLLYLPVVFASQIAFFGGLFVIGATITFWTVESIEVVNIFTYGGREMGSYPMHIYQTWMRRFFTFVIPAIFLNYYPALYFLDKPDPLGMPGFARFLAPVSGTLMLGGAMLVWRLGLRHYQSTGT